MATVLHRIRTPGPQTMGRLLGLLLMPFLLHLTGCMTAGKMDAVMGSWQGRNVNDLVASWGPPTQVLDDGQGGKIYCYQVTSSVTVPGTSTTHGTAYKSGDQTRYDSQTYTSPEYRYQVTKDRMFWVDKAGTIYRWSWRGL
jgi:hypothetical protein